MTSRDFVFWLQGLLEVGEPKQLNQKQIDMIKAHLDLVFKQQAKEQASQWPINQWPYLQAINSPNTQTVISSSSSPSNSSSSLIPGQVYPSQDLANLNQLANLTQAYCSPNTSPFGSGPFNNSTFNNSTLICAAKN